MLPLPVPCSPPKSTLSASHKTRTEVEKSLQIPFRYVELVESEEQWKKKLLVEIG